MPRTISIIRVNLTNKQRAPEKLRKKIVAQFKFVTIQVHT